MESDEIHAKLTITMDGEPERTILLQSLVMIGRSSSCDIVIDGREASRNHAEVRLLAGRYRVSDLGSSNGTWVNGRRLTVPKDLEDGDQIKIGPVQIRFQAAPMAVQPDGTIVPSTRLITRTEHVLVLVADIRNYTGMSEALPIDECSQLVSRWFREASDIIEHHAGVIDKFIGDAIMAWWIVSSKSDPSNEVNRALQASKELIARADVFSKQVSSQFPEHAFKIGIALNIGTAMVGNVGTGENQSFTVVGDSVNVAFRLESLTKEKGPVIVGQGIKESAASEYQFRDLGEVSVKGRKEPVSIWAVQLEGSDS